MVDGKRDDQQCGQALRTMVPSKRKDVSIDIADSEFVILVSPSAAESPPCCA